MYGYSVDYNDDEQLLRGDFDEDFVNDGIDDIDKDQTIDAVEKERRKAERMERNREIARNCRKRKRERIDAIMQEVTQLREANRVLELKLKMAQNKLGEATSGRGNRGKDDEEKRLREVRSMMQMLDHKCSDDEVLRRLEGYTEIYSDFGEERQKLVKVHVNQLEQLLLPTQISKMLMWILKQDDDFYDDDSPGSIWNMLCSQLNLEEHQKKALMEERAHLGAQNASMKKCLKSLNSFEAEVEKNMKARRSQFDKIMSLITPTQTIRFLQWVEENQACVHMLNGLWTVNKQRNQELMKDIMVSNVNKEDGKGGSSGGGTAETDAKKPKLTV